jgi:hypothetical protein
MQSIAAKLTGEKQPAKSMRDGGEQKDPKKKSSWSQMFKKG